jgi:heme A synthase
MKHVVRIVVFHIICIIIFSFLYYNFTTEFDNEISKKNATLLDFILLATTIQVSVGITEIYPKTNITKILVILQQLIMISTNVFTIYFFTV